MKRELIAGLVGLALVRSACGQVLDSYVNATVFMSPPSDPPQILATNFINTSIFSIELSLSNINARPFATAYTLNYTNRGLLSSGTGFRFDTYLPTTQRYYPAANFHNADGGIINCGTSTNLLFMLLSSGAQCLVSATNIINRGPINVGVDGLLRLQGKNVDLSRSFLNMEGFESGFFLSSGMFDGYWGIGNVDMNAAARFGGGFPNTPAHWTTNRYYLASPQGVFPPNAVAYVYNRLLGASNRLVQAAFVGNANDAFANKVYFNTYGIAVEWSWNWTNILFGTNVQDYLYLVDDFNSVTNLQLTTNGIGPASTGFRSVYIPTNYYFYRGGPYNLGTQVSPGMPPGTFINTNASWEYAAYEALFLPTTIIMSDIAGQSATNMPGRIEISADEQLNLDRTRIGGLNYVQLKAPKHFITSGATKIVAPFADYDLSTTNGVLMVTNLIAPSVPRLEGYVDMFSARWTNVDALGFTNTYYILVVDSELAPSVTPQIQNLTLHATNIFVTDVLNVVLNLLMDTENLTVTTNAPGTIPPTGELNLLNTAILWTNAFPRLRNLTNNGTISSQNAAFFEGFRYPPFYPSQFVEPYWNFVNHGVITDQGSFIWSTNFENTGLLDSGSGSTFVQAGTATLSNGVLNALGGDITLAAGSLLISNHVLNAGRALTLTITNTLDDGGLTNGNVWLVGNGGLNLLVRPAVGSLLGTTVTNAVADFAMPTSVWAGEDRGAVWSGYPNNSALGRLILDGGPNSLFGFQAAGASNALYIDYLELKNGMTNRDAGGNLAGMEIGPGMKVYFAQAVMNGISVAEKLNRKNGGRLLWVSGYAGQFSSTNLVYPDGTTNRVNAALAQSRNLDSDNDGIVNSDDSSPIFVPNQFQFTLTLTNRPPRLALLSWQSIANATNALYAKASLAGNWQLVTNFVLGPVNGRATVADPVGPSSRFYQLRIDVPQP
jgi:hypothetical protein